MVAIIISYLEKSSKEKVFDIFLNADINTDMAKQMTVKTQDLASLQKDIIIDINQIITSSLDIKDVFKSISKELHKVIDFDRMSISILSEERDTFDLYTIWKGSRHTQIKEGTYPVRGSILGRVIHTNGPVFIEDTKKCEFWTIRKLRKELIHSYFAYPLKKKGQIIGTINFGSKEAKRYTPEEGEFIKQISGQIAISIDNAGLLSKVKESEERLRGLINSMKDGIYQCEIGPEGVFTFINQAGAEMLGYGSPEEIIGLSVKDMYVNPQDRDMHISLLLKNEVVKDFVIEAKTSNEKRVYIETTSSLIKDKKGNPIRIEGIMRDITEKKALEEQLKNYTSRLEELVQERTDGLRESEEKYRLLIENANDMVFMIDPETTKVLEANSKATELTKYTKSELQSKIITDIHPEHERDRVKRILNRIYKAGKPVRFDDISFETKEGERINIDMSANMIEIGSKKVIQSICRDITEKLKLETQLLYSARLAAMGELSSQLAHEINNPIAGMQCCLSLLADEIKEDNPKRKFLDMTQKEVDRVEKLIQNMRAFYKPSSDTMAPTDINTLIKDMLLFLNQQLKACNIIAQTDLKTELPKILATEDQIRQVFLNLINNARDAMPNGGTLTITTSTVNRDARRYVKIQFDDTGYGIPEEHLPKIFDPFFSTKSDSGGSGLGLSISYSIIQRHKGTIRVKSELGKGTTFIIELPYTH
ncbi:MAG TPA: PAS domain S-box protein [Candidatus Brocadiales bacterium]|nr:PAS domain S-box protein [Candidatus Brocadiales bacterium]